MFENVLNSLFGGGDDPQNNGGSSDPQDAGAADVPQDGGAEALPGGIDPDVPHEPRVSGDPDPGDPPADDSTDGSASAARNATDTNTIGPQADGPIITPPLRVLLQYDTGWAYKNLRPADKQNGCYSPLETDHGEGDPNSWKDNGCYPVSFTMVMRWWCEDYEVTQKQVVAPSNFIAYPSTLSPLTMCQIFGGSTTFHCTAKPLQPRCPTSLPSNNQPGNGPQGPTTGAPKCNTLFSLSPANPDGTQPCKGCGTDLSKLDPSANMRAGHGTYSVGEIAGYAKQLSFQGNNMSYERWKCDKETGETKTAKLKAWLMCGPVMVNMTKPGHWVVVTGYRSQIIYIGDPGHVVASKKYYKGGTPEDGNVQVDESWLACVMAMDLLTFHPIVDANQNAKWLY